jgi:hypothetical protein
MQPTSSAAPAKLGKRNPFTGFAHLEPSAGRKGFSGSNLVVMLVALAIVTGLAWQAERQISTTDPFALRPGITSLRWWSEPIERNPHLRVPFTYADLNAMTFLDDGLRGWAVGEGGMILHTENGGLTWERQPWEASGAPPAARPHRSIGSARRTRSNFRRRRRASRLPHRIAQFRRHQKETPRRLPARTTRPRKKHRLRKRMRQRATNDLMPSSRRSLKESSSAEAGSNAMSRSPQPLQRTHWSPQPPNLLRHQALHRRHPAP